MSSIVVLRMPTATNRRPAAARRSSRRSGRPVPSGIRSTSCTQPVAGGRGTPSTRPVPLDPAMPDSAAPAPHLSGTTLPPLLDGPDRGPTRPPTAGTIAAAPFRRRDQTPWRAHADHHRPPRSDHGGFLAAGRRLPGHRSRPVLLQRRRRPAGGPEAVRRLPGTPRVPRARSGDPRGVRHLGRYRRAGAQAARAPPPSGRLTRTRPAPAPPLTSK